jgi:hypothetical protein
MNTFVHFQRHTAPGASDPQSLSLAVTDTCIAQVDIAGNAVVALQGRLSPEFAWLDLATFNESAVRPVTLAPFMRYEVRDLEAGAQVTAGLASV